MLCPTRSPGSPQPSSGPPAPLGVCANPALAAWHASWIGDGIPATAFPTSDTTHGAWPLT